MISIIIPTFNEAENLRRVLDQLSSQSPPPQIIIADGGSSDATLAIAAEYNAHIVSAPKGRGRQLEAGALLAQGSILFFLHADCRFPAGGLQAIQRHLDDQRDCVGGNFRLHFDGESNFAQWLTRFYGWIRERGLYYGDSGIFVRRDVYLRLGGMRPLDLMEDYDFSRRLEKAGQTVCVTQPALTTSSRKFEGKWGPAIVWGWLKIHALYYLGVSPKKLAIAYYGKG